ncbi:MAG: hypothetical protein ACI867_000497, partial [Glaciecola sp.]
MADGEVLQGLASKPPWTGVSVRPFVMTIATVAAIA